MRLARPRFTVRWLILLVACSGLIDGSLRELQYRRLRFERLAADHWIGMGQGASGYPSG